MIVGGGGGETAVFVGVLTIKLSIVQRNSNEGMLLNKGIKLPLNKLTKEGTDQECQRKYMP